jgi:plastocyanin
MIMPKGGPLSYTNLDAVQHDVVASDNGPDGQPLFRTPLIGLGGSAPVTGVEKLEGGKSYGFFCSLHPNMRGTVNVQ